MNMYYVEITDTFGGEANYSWVTRHKVAAASPRGAVVRLNRASGLGLHKVADYGRAVRYDSKSGATCAFIELWDSAYHANYQQVNEELSK